MPTTKPQPTISRIAHDTAGCRVLIAVPADYSSTDILSELRGQYRELYHGHTWTVEEGAEACKWIEGFVYRWCVGEKKKEINRDE